MKLFQTFQFEFLDKEGKWETPVLSHLLIAIKLFVAGDMEFKQNKTLPVEKQIVTANPDINTVCNIPASVLFSMFWSSFFPCESFG